MGPVYDGLVHFPTSPEDLVPALALALLAATLGLVHGYLNGTGLGLSATALVAALGLAAAVFVLTALVAVFVVSLRAPWTRIAVRVGGSWIAARGVLMPGWSLRAA